MLPICIARSAHYCYPSGEYAQTFNKVNRGTPQAGCIETATTGVALGIFGTILCAGTLNHLGCPPDFPTPSYGDFSTGCIRDVKVLRETFTGKKASVTDKIAKMV
ncbi:MAG: hypothetical protein V4489_07735 [Chlamydiota bacterium]